ncbi:hypothetical protein PISMIDRAFT_607663 [Pisolithus microcarpus 441]|uniref:Uncharacterized protein n=1 Tax=Pisolithus microcarpus 441 TaxID=765257 RepID=A0A0D0A838_9AGAM|nr:hypothetical protein PISMIDRAFT_607663 [Pisolithus microcarpus 441]
MQVLCRGTDLCISEIRGEGTMAPCLFNRLFVRQYTRTQWYRWLLINDQGARYGLLSVD